MKRYISLVALFVAALVCRAQASIEWQQTEHNFGAFDEESGMASCRFVYRNTGNEPLVLTGVRANCGCTTPRYSDAPLQPGDTASILVRYDPAGRPGRFNKNIYVDSNTEPSRTTLSIRGVVIGSTGSVKSRFPVDIGPLKARSGAVMLGTVKKGRCKAEYLDCYNSSADTLHPVITNVPQYLEVRALPAAVPPGEQVSISFYLRTDRCPEWGIVTDSVTIIPDAKRGERDAMRMPFVAIVEEDFTQLTPGQREKAPKAVLADTSLDFGNILKSDCSQVRTTKLCNTGLSTMQIRRVYSADESVKVACDKTSLKKGKCCTITVTVDPEKLHGALLNTRVTVITNDPMNHTQTFRVVGY